jgi:protein-S-isoprenylcysteine O-methyltransferase Ste14
MIALYFLLPIVKFIPFPWNLVGIVPLSIGIYLNLVADHVFKKRATTVKPYEESTALVTDGVFSISRHPMYLGMVLLLLGLALLLGSLSPFVVVVVFGIAMEKVFIKVEEKMMQETFGAQYVKYKEKVRKWI